MFSLSSTELFIYSSISFLLVVLMFVFKKPSNIVKFFKEEKKTARGVILALIFIIVGSVVSEKISATPETKSGLFPGWYIFVGLDNTNHQSPMCETRSARFGSDKLTSNIGAGINVIVSKDKMFELNIQYTHHSCSFSGDKLDYDAIGVSFINRFNF